MEWHIFLENGGAILTGLQDLQDEQDWDPCLAAGVGAKIHQSHRAADIEQKATKATKRERRRTMRLRCPRSLLFIKRF
jgi:hypothetical protein